MSIINDNEVCIDIWKIIAHYGYTHQKEKAIEELGELQQALARDLQGNGDRANIAEEIADVLIMLSQLELIYGLAPEVNLAVRDKLGRTVERIEMEREGRT